MARMKLKLNRPITELDFDVDEQSLKSNGWARIVRCGECKYSSCDNHVDGNVPVWDCGNLDMIVSKNWFCADGDEREVQE